MCSTCNICTTAMCCAAPAADIHSHAHACADEKQCRTCHRNASHLLYADLHDVSDMAESAQEAPPLVAPALVVSLLPPPTTSTFNTTAVRPLHHDSHAPSPPALPSSSNPLSRLLQIRSPPTGLFRLPPCPASPKPLSVCPRLHHPATGPANALRRYPHCHRCHRHRCVSSPLTRSFSPPSAL